MDTCPERIIYDKYKIWVYLFNKNQNTSVYEII